MFGIDMVFATRPLEKAESVEEYAEFLYEWRDNADRMKMLTARQRLRMIDGERSEREYSTEEVLERMRAA